MWQFITKVYDGGGAGPFALFLNAVTILDESRRIVIALINKNKPDCSCNKDE